MKEKSLLQTLTWLRVIYKYQLKKMAKMKWIDNLSIRLLADVKKQSIKSVKCGGEQDVIINK